MSDWWWSQIKKGTRFILKGITQLSVTELEITEGLKATPERVADMYRDFMIGYQYQLQVVREDEKRERFNGKHGNLSVSEDGVIPITVFENKEGYDDLVIKTGEYLSFCEHHLVPFTFTYAIAYLPGKYIVGLSKLGDIVKYFAGKLQLQERLTKEIADWIWENIEPKGVMVIIKGKHLCEYITRGEVGEMTTSAIRGIFEDMSVRQEALKLLQDF